MANDEDSTDGGFEFFEERGGVVSRDGDGLEGGGAGGGGGGLLGAFEFGGVDGGEMGVFHDGSESFRTGAAGGREIGIFAVAAGFLGVADEEDGGWLGVD